jgi:arginine-tRNA-protein transferase
MIGKNRDREEQISKIPIDLERFFIHAAAECPYGRQERAIYHQAVLGRISDQTMGDFLAQGYRRNGNCMYTMRCPDCARCVPIRIRPERFRANRNQRRVWRKNADVSVEIAPLTMSRENIILLQHFLSTRFPQGKSRAESYYAGFFITSISRCFEVRYKAEGELLGVAIVDAAPEWMNAVYFFFDPAQGWRSPGTFNILTLNDICLTHRITSLYLGYWIDGHQGMGYKNAFRPHELLLEGRWVEQN